MIVLSETRSKLLNLIIKLKLILNKNSRLKIGKPDFVYI